MRRTPHTVLTALLLTLLLALTPVQAQNGEALAIDYAAWDTRAGFAESRVENPRTREDTLNAVRAELVAARAQFAAAQTQLRARSEGLREQIAALGPAPTDGATEPAEIAERRAELSAQLAEPEAPLRAADEAYARADATIRSIDRELRTRQANALMALGPTPLNPANWLDGFGALLNTWLTVRFEIEDAWADVGRRRQMVNDLPITLGALALAGLLLLRGRRWMEQLTARLLQSTAILRGRVVAAFFVSLSQLVVPFVGLLLLGAALQLSQMTGPMIDTLTEVTLTAGMTIFGARWLSLHLFPFIDDPQLSINLNAADRRRARSLVLLFAVFAGIAQAYEPVIGPQRQLQSAHALLLFPLVVLAGLTLVRFARVLRRHQPRRAEVEGVDVDTAPFFDRMLFLGCRVLMLLGVLAPVLGAVGYMAAAQHLVFPAISSLALIGLVMVLHRLITAIYTAIVGEDDRSARGLVPALAGLVLSAVALPPLTLIWGARDTDLLEIYTRFNEGFLVGGSRLSPTTILWFIVVFGIGYVVTRALQGALGSSVLPKTTMEKGAQNAVVSGVGYVGITAATLAAFSVAGIDLSGLAIVAGALSVGIGFGLQNIVSNFVSGIILLIERPVSEGDWVQVGETSGTIERISVRSTMIKTFDQSKVIVPNADLISGAVTNFTKTSKTGRVIVPVGVAYGTDTRRVEAILREIVEAEPLVVLDPKPSVFFMRFGADALEFEVRAILRDVNYKVAVTSDINHQIAARFAAEGIEIPFAQREVRILNPEALATRPPAAPPPGPTATRPLAQPDRDADAAAEGHDQTDPEFREATR